jgi:hypothetical protein
MIERRGASPRLSARRRRVQSRQGRANPPVALRTPLEASRLSSPWLYPGMVHRATGLSTMPARSTLTKELVVSRPRRVYYRGGAGERCVADRGHSGAA